MGTPKSILKLEFATGTPLLETLAEMKEKAIKFDVAFIESRINNIDVFISQKASISEAYETFKKAVNEKKDFIVS
jgi:lipoate-protein ligase A